MTTHGAAARIAAALLTCAAALAAASCGSSPDDPSSGLSADLRMVSIATDSQAIAAGHKLGVSVTVQNQGLGLAAKTAAKVWLSSSPTALATDDPLIGSIQIPSAAAGDTLTASGAVTIPASATGGASYVWIQLEVEPITAQSYYTKNAPLTVYRAVTTTTTHQFTLTLLGDLLGDSMQVTGFNDAGQVVAKHVGPASARNVLLQNATVTDLGACVPDDINDAGTIACEDMSIWQNGQVTPIDLDTTQFKPDAAPELTINDSGEVSGMLVNLSGDRQCTYCAFLWTPGHLLVPNIEVDGLGVQQLDVARNRTSPGMVVLEHVYHGGTSPLRYTADGTRRSINCNAGIGMYDSGDFIAIGGADALVGANGTGAIVCKDGVQTRLGPGTARDMSRKGVAAGDVNGHGFVLYTDFTMAIIDDGLTTPGWTVLHGDFVNDNGQIVATAKSKSDGHTEQVLITQTH